VRRVRRLTPDHPTVVAACCLGVRAAARLAVVAAELAGELRPNIVRLRPRLLGRSRRARRLVNLCLFLFGSRYIGDALGLPAVALVRRAGRRAGWAADVRDQYEEAGNFSYAWS